MIIKRCDRCGKTYDKNSIYELHPRIGIKETTLGLGIVTDSGACKKRYDLCDDCSNDFRKWMEKSEE